MRRFTVFVIILAFFSFFTSISLAESYTAFSFKNARELIKKRNNNPDVLNCAGITRPVALVYDPDNQDIILVGENVYGQKPIHYDDWVVAVRAILKNQKDPAVSIDRTNETDKTGLQKVRFEGGLEDTRFGQDLLDADIVLKRLGLGTKESPQVFGIKSYMDLSVDDYKNTGELNRLVSRFWFLPDRSSSYVHAKDNTVVVEEYRIGVRNEVMGSDTELKTDAAAEDFALRLQQNFPEVKLYFDELERLEQLYYVAALAQGMDASGISKKTMVSYLVSYWLHDYKLNTIHTPREYRLEDNSRESGNVSIELSGGVSLDALVIDLQDGVADAVNKYVISARPDKQSLSWEVPLVSFVWNTVYEPSEIERMKQVESKRVNLGMSIYKNMRQIDTTPVSSVANIPVAINTRPLSSSSSFVSNLTSPHPAFTPNIRRPYTPDIGGVMLSGVASIAGSGPAKVDLSGGNFSFIVDGKNARLSPDAFRMFITALWTVYYSNQDPGISIDPIAPGVDKHMVRYIGKVVNTDLGRVMRKADYDMKKYAVGTERPDIPGFKNPDEYSAEKRKLIIAASRFWFIPEDMRFKRGDDMLLFDGGRMTIQTEYLTDSAKKSADPSNEKFAEFFTEHYDEFSERYPVFEDLFDYAKMVSLAKYLKEQGIPLFWFLMANKDLVLTEDSPSTVDELVKDSDYFRGIMIKGGVDLGFDTEDQGNYVYDQTAMDAINEARSKFTSDTESGAPESHDRKITRSNPNPFSFDLGKESYTVVPQHSLTSGKDRRGIRYQTDMALRGKGLQLTPHSLDILKNDLVYRETMEEMESISKTVEEHNLDQEDIDALYGSKKKKAERKVDVIFESLDKMMNKKYSDKDKFVQSLEESIGAEQTDKLKDQIMKAAYYSTSLELVRYFNPKEKGNGEFGNGWKLLVPYKVKKYGDAMQLVNNYPMSKRMVLVNSITGEEEILSLNTELYTSVAYVPDELGDSQVVGLIIMRDGSYQLHDKLKNEFWFNPDGYLTDMVFSKDYRVKYEYLEGFTDAFENNPYSIEPDGDDMVGFLNVTIPKRMKLTDLVHGESEVLTFNEEGNMSGYVPEDVDNSRYKIVALMSDASFRLIDRNGNETALKSSGGFNKMAVSDEHAIVSAVSQGSHKISFKYTIDNMGNVTIASANLSEGEDDQNPTLVVKYEYDVEGRLCAVTKTNNKVAEKQVTEDTIKLASK
ncbi:MAG: hypothetical protein GY797_27025 [Deltaproteobacteria bacterium]|nr:hypothetical protein [Deltaproteobacteria bacterium]